MCVKEGRKEGSKRTRRKETKERNEGKKAEEKWCDPLREPAMPERRRGEEKKSERIPPPTYISNLQPEPQTTRPCHLVKKQGGGGGEGRGGESERAIVDEQAKKTPERKEATS
jgi:hypothetical protein